MATIGSGEPSGNVGYAGPACVVGGASVVGGAVVGATVVGAGVVVGACVVAGATVVAGAALVGGAILSATSSNSEVGAPTVIASSEGVPSRSDETPATTPPTARAATSPNNSERFGEPGPDRLPPVPASRRQQPAATIPAGGSAAAGAVASNPWGAGPNGGSESSGESDRS